jgi:hypothetical protein
LNFLPVEENYAMKITRSAKIVVGIAAVASLGLTGCSSSDNAAPSDSPTQSPTTPGEVTKYSLSAGGKVKITGLDQRYRTTGGTMSFRQTDGVLGGRIEVFARGNTQTGDFDMTLVTDASGAVTSGSLTSPGLRYAVIAAVGKINFLATDNSTTLVTVEAIPVQSGTETPTTMTINLTGDRS